MIIKRELKALNFLWFAFLGCVILSSCASSKAKQDTKIKKELLEVDNFISQNRLTVAKEKLHILNSLYPNSAELVNRLAGVEYRLQNKLVAYHYFNKADSLYDRKNLDIKYSLGILNYELGKVEEAENSLSYFLNLNPSNASKIKRATQVLNSLKRYNDFRKDSLLILIKPLGTNINTQHQEYYAYLTADDTTLIFTRKKQQSEQLLTSKLENQEWGSAEEIAVAGTGASTLSADGLTLVTSLCDARSSIGSCDLFITKLKNGAFPPLKNMGDVINSISWDAQPYLSADGMKLLFSSERKGGFGGKDLYMSEYSTRGWSDPKSIGSLINTPFNEESPFLHPDGKTLYFRSDRTDGIGGFDIYLSRWEEINKTWGAPIILGYPINTLADEGALTVSRDGVTSFMSSDRLTAGTANANLDILTFQLPTEFRANPTTYFSLSTIDSISNLRVGSTINIIDQLDGKLIFAGLSSEEGPILIPLIIGKKYAILVNKDDYYPTSTFFEPTNIIEKANLELKVSKINKAKPIVLKNILFESNSSKLDTTISKTELDYLRQFLLTNPSLQIKIVGHTDDIGSETYNQTLSINRSESLKNYLIGTGIKDNRILTSGVGESQPIDSNATEQGKRNNRRIEIYIL
jgi:outer membrane protein OmpA-like peptidoglycan-associated protein